MEYTINKLAKLANISTRTLRYYNEIGLLSPVRISSNGYRMYSSEEVKQLQQILFYRELGVPLEQIKLIIHSENFNEMNALQRHLESLVAKKENLELLISNAEKTLKTMREGKSMEDRERFTGFMKNLVNDNERTYGTEIRKKYGDDVIDRSNAKVAKMSKAEYEEIEKLTAELNDTLRLAFEEGDPTSELAQKVSKMHKDWLCYFWDSYSKEAHVGVTQMYIYDPRFTAYYDKIAIGCAQFLHDSVAIYCTDL